MPSSNPLDVNLIASLFESLKVILSNVAFKFPLFSIVISYSIESPGLTKLVLNVAVKSSHEGSSALVALPTIFLLTTFVISTFQLLLILLVPFMFNILLKAAYPTAISNTTAHKLPIIILFFFFCVIFFLLLHYKD